MNELVERLSCPFKSENDLNVSMEAMSVDFNKDKAEKGWLKCEIL